MRIEILIGNSEEPLIYPINNSKVSVGSSETCDVIIDAPNVSRKHVQIISEGDSFYVVDQGSTNGTFINEERLIPGRRTEFTSFFPVRLGDSVLITLLSDEETVSDEPPTINFPEARLPDQKSSVPGRGGDETTKMISLRDLQKAKTSDLVNRRKEIVKKKTSPEKSSLKNTKPKSKRAQDSSRMRKIQFFVLVLIGVAGYLNFVVYKPEGEVKVAKVGEEIPADKRIVAPVEVKKVEPSLLVPEAELPERERVAGILSDIKCTLEIEKYFCEKVYKGNELPFGTVQIGSTIFILSDGDFFYQEAKKYLPLAASVSPDGVHTPEELAAYESELQRVMAAIYLSRAMPADLNFEMVKDFKFVIGLFMKDADGTIKIHSVISVLPEAFVQFRKVFEDVHLVNMSKIGVSAIEFTKRFYRVY